MNRKNKDTDIAPLRGRALVASGEPYSSDLAEALSRSGFAADKARSGVAAIASIREGSVYDAVFADPAVDGASWEELLEAAKERNPFCAFVVVSDSPSLDKAVDAVKSGADGYVAKVDGPEKALASALESMSKLEDAKKGTALARPQDAMSGYTNIIGSSPALKKIIYQLSQIAATDITVLIQGESGSGKELVAKALHLNSHRRHRHFVPLNCAALSEGILESELFGHEKGAFTGAMYQRKGRFEFAHQGTLFLDEIGDMPISTQVKLLRVIESGEVFRVGNNIPVHVDVRLVAATHKRLENLVKEGKFRDDLFYRLKVFTIELPPLRERLEDLPMLAEAFVREFSTKHGKGVSGISREALKALSKYPWPGNVREFRNCIESMIVISPGGELGIRDIPDYISQKGMASAGEGASLSGISIECMEKELIKETLAKVGGNRSEASRILGIGERTLYRKIKGYGLE